MTGVNQTIMMALSVVVMGMVINNRFFRNQPAGHGHIQLNALSTSHPLGQPLSLGWRRHQGEVRWKVIGFEPDKSPPSGNVLGPDRHPKPA
jgi:hypothetical protein